ncbi:MAG: type II toxin-antitoxin system VapC family toxin [Dysgonamonadaceae bacterium]|jgi:predicted nucleic acid-binding protein|nr:type II toxin-antitoxin system VapC family toxin [Dysgonamonadaceae bacterium]
MRLNPYNIFIDTNVLISAFSGKQQDKKCLEYLYSLKGKYLFVSTLSVAQLVSVFQKRETNEVIKDIVRTLIAKFTIVEFTKTDIENSLHFDFSDMEDNIQYVISKKMKCAYFVTNNRKDYISFNLNVLLPKQIRSINQ